jgi:hypothetical protein
MKMSGFEKMHKTKQLSKMLQLSLSSSSVSFNEAHHTKLKRQTIKNKFPTFPEES